MMLVVTLALAAVTTAHADACTKEDAEWEYKNHLQNKYCATSAVDKDSCTTCCKQKDICKNVFGGCSDAPDEVYDNSKEMTLVHPPNAGKDCCTMHIKCNKGCGSTRDNKGGYDNIKCGTSSCSFFECCDTKNDHRNCKGQKDQAQDVATSVQCHEGYVYDSDKDGTAVTDIEVVGGQWKTKCCKPDTCKAHAGEGKACTGKVLPKLNYFDDAKKATSVGKTVTQDDFDASCCTEIELKKCKDIHTACNEGAGWKKEPAAAKKEAYCADTGCTDEQCCDPDTTKCRGYTKPGGDDGDCGDDKYDARFSSKAGNAVAAAKDWIGACCESRASCSSWEATSPRAEAGAAASGAVRQHALVVAPFLALLGLLGN